MTSFLMVLVALFAEAALGKPNASAITLYLIALTPKLATGDRLGENRMGTRLSWRSRFFPIALTPKPATGFGEIPSGSRLQWPSRFDWRTIVLKPAIGGGKFEAETANHGVHAFLRWPSRQTRRLATGSLGKTMGNPFIMAIPREKAAITPKRATCDPRFGKNIWKPVCYSNFLMKKRCSRQNPRSLTDGLGKIEWEPVYLGDSLKKAALMPKLACGLGKIEAEPVYHGDRETKRDRIGEAIWIGETVWIGETMGDGSCRRSDRRREALNSSFAVPRSQRPERPWLQLFLCG